MANMSHCRFSNTLGDLRDCESNMGDDDLSYEEARARRLLIKACVRISESYGDELEEKFPTQAEYESRA